ncbi:MAG: hypothetical protein ACLUTZ_02865 [Oliverpabstia sp.]
MRVRMDRPVSSQALQLVFPQTEIPAEARIIHQTAWKSPHENLFLQRDQPPPADSEVVMMQLLHRIVVFAMNWTAFDEVLSGKYLKIAKVMERQLGKICQPSILSIRKLLDV